MLVAVLVFCPNYAQIMLAFQNYATFLKNYSVHKLHNSQDKFENVFYEPWPDVLGPVVQNLGNFIRWLGLYGK